MIPKKIDSHGTIVPIIGEVTPIPSTATSADFRIMTERRAHLSDHFAFGGFRREQLPPSLPQIM